LTVILLCLVSAASFGAMAVAIRFGLDGGSASGGALAMVTWGTAIAIVAALPQHDFHRSWEFFLAGFLAPGCSQVLFTLSVREAGPSRTSVAVGAAPLVAVAIALAFLGEPVRTLLVLGALAIVCGGVLLALERDRPEHVRTIALLFAVGAMVFFAVRDDIIRALHAHANPEAAAAATFLGGLLVTFLWARRLPTPRELRRLAPAGIFFALSYLCLFEAYFRGRVSVVSPLVATESLWAVGLSAVLLRHEKVGARLVFGALLVVGGGILIGLGRN
jgi:drug/metabolite transporter (DMT)-like permease